MRVLPTLHPFLALRLRPFVAVLAMSACNLDPSVADDFGFGEESGGPTAGPSGADAADETGDGDGSDDGSGTGDGADDGASADVPHAHGTIVLGELHTAGGAGQSTPIVTASFVPDTAAAPPSCAAQLNGCEVTRIADCAPGCSAGEVCGFGASCVATCLPVCDVVCGEGEECYFPVPGSPSCRSIETFDAGALAFSGTTVPITLFPPYAFVGDVTGALALPGAEVTVQASGATAAGFAAFERTFMATDLLVTSIDEITIDEAHGAGPLPVRWEAGADSVRIRITVTGVGGGQGVVTCDVDDTGSFDVPRKAIAAAVLDDEPSTLHLEVERRAVSLYTDATTTGSLSQGTVQPEAWIELVSSSSESITIQGCGSLTYCGGVCVDTLSDEANCGACNAVCSATQTCSSGTCVDGGGGGGACCTASASPGCSDAAIEACVCASDSYCCSSAWDATCVGEVTSLGCGVC